MAKGIAWGQSQFLHSQAGDLPLQSCAWWAVVAWLGKFSVSQAGGNDPSFGTAALANLILNVTRYWSFHAPCMENLTSRHILPWGVVVAWLTLPPSHLPRSCPFLLGFSYVVFSHIRMQQVLPDGSRGCNFNWCQFYVTVRLCWVLAVLFPWVWRQGSLSVINYIGWAWEHCCLAPNIYILNLNPLDPQVHLVLSHWHIMRHFHLSLIRHLLSSSFF